MLTVAVLFLHVFCQIEGARVALGLGSSVKLKPFPNFTNLADYTPDVLMDIGSSPSLSSMVSLVQRDLVRLRHIRYLDKAEYNSLFPTNFGRDKNIKTMLGAAAGLFTSVDASIQLPKIWHLLGLTAAHVVNAVSVADAIDEYVEELRRHDEGLLKRGAHMGTEYWNDVLIGEIASVYERVLFAKENHRLGAPTVLFPAKLTDTSSGKVADDVFPQPSFPKPVPTHDELRDGPKSACDRGDVVGDLAPGDMVEIMRKTDVKGERTGCLRVRRTYPTQQIGWVQADAIGHIGWYRAVAWISIYDSDGWTTGDELEPDDMITVVRKVAVRGGVKWMLGDGRGWVKDVGSLRGPLPKCEYRVCSDGIPVSNAHPGTAAGAAALQAGNMYSSTPSVIGRMLLKGGLFVGGFFTGGVTWTALTITSIAEAAADVAAASTAQLKEARIAFVVGAVARLEAEAAKAPECDIVEKAPCPTGQICMRMGAFGGQLGSSQRTGKCMLVARPVLPVYSYCNVDQDCASSYCHFRTSEGTDGFHGECRQPCELTNDVLPSWLFRSNGCTQIVRGFEEFGIRTDDRISPDEWDWIPFPGKRRT